MKLFAVDNDDFQPVTLVERAGLLRLSGRY